MVTINVNLDRVLDQDSSANLTGKQRLEVSYLRLQLDGDAKRVLTTDAITWDLTDGVGSFKVDVTPELNAIQVIGRGFRPGFRMCFQVTSGDDGKDLSELTPIDPTTLDPLEPASPAWLAQVAELKDQIDTKADTNSLASVATSGQYGDLTGTPSLGTAAAADATDFATAAQGSKADAALPAAGLDQAAADLLANPASQLAEEVTAKIGETIGIDSTQRMLAKIEADLADTSILIIGDSTGNDPTEWVYLLAGKLGAKYPTHTVAYRLWDDSAGDYGTATSVTTGSGSRTITLYNASVSGFSTTSWQGLRSAKAIYDLAPDLVIVSLGHNEQATAADWHPRMTSLTESVMEKLSSAAMVLIAQNPATGNTMQQQRREVYREIASQRGYGFIDVCQAFLDTGDAPGLTVDGMHPTPAGSELWAETVAAAFVRDQRVVPRPQPPSTLVTGAVNLLRNGDFSEGEDFWYLYNCTSVVDTTNFETAVNTSGAPTTFTSTARKFTAGGTGGILQQNVAPQRVRGKWITLAVRLFVPTGQAATVGRVGLADSAGSVSMPAESSARGAFRWAVATRFVPPAATNTRALIYIDSSASGAGNCTIDRIILAEGKYPRSASA